MCLKSLESKRRHPFTWSGSCLLAAAAITAASSLAWAQARPAAAAGVVADSGAAHLAKLEDDFWTCDYVASTHGVTFTPIDTCAAVTEHLKNEKFGGEFKKMLEWWRLNKAGEYLKIQTIEKRWPRGSSSASEKGLTRQHGAE